MTAAAEHDVYLCECGEYHCLLDPDTTGCIHTGVLHCSSYECGPCRDEAAREMQAEWAADARRFPDD